MHINWRAVAGVGARVAEAAGVPGAVAIEAQVEGAVDSKTNIEKGEQALEAGLKVLEAEGALAGKNYATPRVEAAIRHLRDSSVELVNALAEAHGA